jgi:gluconokinase
MGVSGSGKSTIAAALAERLGWTFEDGDRFHPASNVAKMHAGHPLTDEDRWPWLQAIADEIDRVCHASGHVVIACSALKRGYRDALASAAPTVRFLQLALDPEVARARVADRPGHFMPASLVESQFCEYEPLQRGEPGITVDATRELEVKLAAFRAHLAAAGEREP